MIVLWLFPAEAFNRLCLILPGRLIIHGLRYYGARIGERTTFTPPIVFHNIADKSRNPFSRLQVGSDCYFGREIFLDLKESLVIEDHVTVAMGVMILTHTDVAQSPLRNDAVRTSQKAVLIREGAYLGARSTILEGIEIGSCAVVAAGAVVNKSVPAGTVYAGIPAREIKRIF